jgi:hypothetical protein
MHRKKQDDVKKSVFIGILQGLVFVGNAIKATRKGRAWISQNNLTRPNQQQVGEPEAGRMVQ